MSKMNIGVQQFHKVEVLISSCHLNIEKEELVFKVKLFKFH